LHELNDVQPTREHGQLYELNDVQQTSEHEQLRELNDVHQTSEHEQLRELNDVLQTSEQLRELNDVQQTSEQLLELNYVQQTSENVGEQLSKPKFKLRKRKIIKPADSGDDIPLARIVELQSREFIEQNVNEHAFKQQPDKHVGEQQHDLSKKYDRYDYYINKKLMKTSKLPTKAVNNNEFYEHDADGDCDDIERDPDY